MSLPQMTVSGVCPVSAASLPWSLWGWKGAKLIISGVRTRHPEVEITGQHILQTQHPLSDHTLCDWGSHPQLAICSKAALRWGEGLLLP